jgi:hypothetical protein
VHHPLGCHRSRIPDRVVFNKLVQPYSISYRYLGAGPGNASSPNASRMRCHRPCFNHNS